MWPFKPDEARKKHTGTTPFPLVSKATAVIAVGSRADVAWIRRQDGKSGKSSADDEKLANAKLKPFALTFSQFKALRLLAIESPEAVRQVDIERAFSMTNPTVTSLLHGLENGGWIERVENPDDNRSKLVRLTKKAERIAADLESLGNEIEAELTGALSDEEKSTLHALLLKMVPQEN